MLESQMHAASVFVTLTFSEEALRARGHCNVSVRDLQVFNRRLRKVRGSFRFFGCGEYGDKGGRPHYHAILFGVSVFEEEAIARCWPEGFVLVAELTPERAAYVTGYVSKKWTKADAPGLFEREPEFARMSLRPGIGAPAVAHLGGYFTGKAGSAVLSRLSDVPASCRVSGKVLPIGRYLRGRLRQQVGWSEKVTPVSIAEMRAAMAVEPAADREVRRGKAARLVEGRLRLEKSKRTL